MLTPQQRIDFGRYLRGLREGKSLSLGDVQREAGISKGYLSLIEAGQRNPPSSEFLRKLAALYGSSPADMLARAGRLNEETEADLELDELRRAYEFVISDRRFPAGHRLTGEPTPDLMRFMVEMYQAGTGKKLLGGKAQFTLDLDSPEEDP